MHLSELIENLTRMADELDDDPRVLVAIQPSYPLCVDFEGVALQSDIDEEDRMEAIDRGEYDPATDGEFDASAGTGHGGSNVVWLVTGSHPYDVNPYAPRGAWSVAR